MTETLTFDAGWLARAWLSVAEASSKDTGRPALDRTVCVEFFPDGVRRVPCWEETNGGGAGGAMTPVLSLNPDILGRRLELPE